MSAQLLFLANGDGEAGSSERHLVTPEKPKVGHCKDWPHCRCHPANFPQNCQACQKRIRKGHCIFNNGSSGWTHTYCGEMDDTRGPKAIQSGFLPVHYGVIEAEPTTASDASQSVQRILNFNQEFDEQTNCRSNDGLGDETEEPTRKRARISSDESSGEDDKSCRTTTREQQAILSHVPEVGGSPICVNALAGCGKTTTIAILCQILQERNPRWNFLYLVFNKKNQLEANHSGKFPKKNMEVRTTHAFCLRHYFGPTKMINVETCDFYSKEEIEKSIGLSVDVQHLLYPGNSDAFKNISSAQRSKFSRHVSSVATFIQQTLNNFQASGDNEVQLKHVSWRAKQSTGLSPRSHWREKIPTVSYVSWTAQLFNAMRDRCHAYREGQKGAGVVAHDTYLKVAQLETDMTEGYDVILADETQDMTPCQADLIWGRQSRLNRVIYLFGDRYQQLYRFRGASTSFEEMCDNDSSHNFSLTGSFRFGENIADAASLVLEAVAGPKLVGRAQDPGERLAEAEFEQQGVVLCRTNQGIDEYLFLKRPRMWCHLDGRQKAYPRPEEWVYELENFLEQESNSSLFQYRGEDFTTLKDIQEYIDDESDKKLLQYLMLLKFLKEQNTSLEDHLDYIQCSFIPLEDGQSPDKYAGVVIGTVHKAKGLEFDNVLISNDFKFELIAPSSVSNERHSDEANVFYVALTRARKRLFLCPAAQDCLQALSQRIRKAEFQLHYLSISMEENRVSWEESWQLFRSSKAEILSTKDIPWPSSDDYDDDNLLALDSKMTEVEQRGHLRKILLRYHPDKFFPKYEPLICGSDTDLKRIIKEKIHALIQSTTEVLANLQNPDEQ